MKSDFEPIIKHIPGNNDIIIYPLSDLHVGAAEFLESKWNAFKKTILEQKNAYITIGGDMMNNSTRSSIANVFEETMRPREQKRWLANELAPLRDRILCAVSGNHERRSEKDADDNPLYDVMTKLDLEDIYRPNMAFVKIQVGKRSGDGNRNPTYTMGVIHGAGGGINTGSSVSRNERFGHVIDGIDCLIVGHSHKPAVTKPKKLYFDTHNNQIKERQYVVITSSPWLSYGGYALRGQLLPASNDVQLLRLKGNRKRMVVEW